MPDNDNQNSTAPSGEAAVPNPEQVMDWGTFMDRVEGDQELARELVSVFLDGLNGQMEQIRQAVSRAEALALRTSAHSLKGAVSNFGAKEATEAALALENIGRSGDLGEASEALTRLEQEINRIRPVLEAWGKKQLPKS